jgi:hypothetical protein
MGILSRFLKYRGKRLITCPENGDTAAVDVDVIRATFSDPKLNACSRWPEKAGCDQKCLAQIEETPTECRLSTIVTSWYAGKECFLCGRPIGPIVWHERPPALLSPKAEVFEWKEIAPENLPRVFATHRPLCWTCYLAESFRQEFPNLPVDRQRPVPAPPEPLNTTNVY